MDENTNSTNMPGATPTGGDNKFPVMVLVVLVMLVVVGLGGAYYYKFVYVPSMMETISEEIVEDYDSKEVMIDKSKDEPVGKTEDKGEDGQAGMMAVKTVEMEAGAFYYKPNMLTVKKGEKVKIMFTAIDMMHDFVIDELQVKMPVVKSGNTGSVEFTADKVGTFEYYCSVGKHRANGQVGKLIVTE